MRIIIIRREPINTFQLLKSTLENSAHTPLTIDMIRKRCKILDKIDEAEKSHGNSLHIEDDEHVALWQALEKFPWGVANRDVLRIIDDVKDAKTMPKGD